MRTLVPDEIAGFTSVPCSIVGLRLKNYIRIMISKAKPSSIYQMRQSGATLQQIANRCGISRERVRRLLIKYYGSTRIQDFLTMTELAHLAGCTQRYIYKLEQRGTIKPAKVIGRGRTLWDAETAATITLFIDSHRCRVCNEPVPSNRQVYCSRACALKAPRYENNPEQARRLQKARVAKWRATHPERAREIQRRAERKYQAKKAAEPGIDKC